jgi:hypothetical protein
VDKLKQPERERAGTIGGIVGVFVYSWVAFMSGASKMSGCSHRKQNRHYEGDNESILVQSCTNPQNRFQVLPVGQRLANTHRRFLCVHAPSCAAFALRYTRGPPRQGVTAEESRTAQATVADTVAGAGLEGVVPV